MFISRIKELGTVKSRIHQGAVFKMSQLSIRSSPLPFFVMSEHLYIKCLSGAWHTNSLLHHQIDASWHEIVSFLRGKIEVNDQSKTYRVLAWARIRLSKALVCQCGLRARKGCKYCAIAQRVAVHSESTCHHLSPKQLAEFR